MMRHALFLAMGLLAFTAAREAHADTISCSFPSPSGTGPNGGPGFIELSSFEFGVEQSVTGNAGSGGSGAGKVQLSGFSDGSTSKLVQAAVGGIMFSSVICTVFGTPPAPGVAPNPYLTAVLTNVSLGSFDFNRTDCTGDGRPRAKLSFNVANIVWSSIAL